MARQESGAPTKKQPSRRAMTGIDYYRILGVPSSATKRAIRAAYLDLVRRLHPDRAGSEGTARFQQVAEAYEHLSDPEKRLLYDRASGYTRVCRPKDIESVGSRDFPQPPAFMELEVTLTPTEALRGAVLPLVVLAEKDCPWCGGRGGLESQCQGCGGNGVMVGEQVIRARIPAGIRDGVVLEMPLYQTGREDRYLRLYISVQRHTALW